MFLLKRGKLFTTYFTDAFASGGGGGGVVCVFCTLLIVVSEGCLAPRRPIRLVSHARWKLRKELVYSEECVR